MKQNGPCYFQLIPRKFPGQGAVIQYGRTKSPINLWTAHRYHTCFIVWLSSLQHMDSILTHQQGAYFAAFFFLNNPYSKLERCAKYKQKQNSWSNILYMCFTVRWTSPHPGLWTTEPFRGCPSRVTSEPVYLWNDPNRCFWSLPQHSQSFGGPLQA